MATITLDASLKDVLEYAVLAEHCTPAQLTVNSSLDLTQVPEKLRCVNCQTLNLSPYKTSCCDVYICESCKSAYTWHLLQIPLTLLQVSLVAVLAARNAITSPSPKTSASLTNRCELPSRPG
jgi:hypothetical protein